MAFGTDGMGIIDSTIATDNLLFADEFEIATVAVTPDVDDPAFAEDIGFVLASGDIVCESIAGARRPAR
jgi:hypothetical protein